MKVQVHLDIGYPTAQMDDVIEIPDEILAELTQEERDREIKATAEEWAWNYINISYKEL